MELNEGSFDLEHLPPFANEYNKQLAAEIKERERNLAETEKAIQNNIAKNLRMREHLKNVANEAQNAQQLGNSKAKELETEEHLKQLAERETGRLKTEIDKLNAKIKELEEKSTAVQKAIFKTTLVVEKYQKQLDLHKDQLDQWAEAKRQKEEDNLILNKYTRADDVRIKDLGLQIEKLTKAFKARQSELDREVTDTRAGQIELDKTSEEFRKLHKERQELLSQWEEAIKSMERRDQAIESSSGILNDLKKKNFIAEKLKFLDSQKANNKELETKISNADRILTKLRSDYGQAQTAATEYADELEALKNTLKAAATNLDSKKQEIAHFKREIEKKKARIEKQKKIRDKTQHNLDVHYQHTDDLDARAKQLDMYYKTKETSLQKSDKEQKDLKQQIFKESQELFKLRQEEQNILSELSGAKAAERNLQAKIQRLDTESLKQQELVYNQEYQLQQLERKISRVQGERSNEEKQILTDKIKELSWQLDRQDETKKLLNDQLKKIGDDVRVAKRKLEGIRTEKDSLLTSINELHLENDSSQRALRSISQKKEQILVTENFVRLDVKRLKDLLYIRTDEVFNLEKQKLQLKLSMEQRKQEISVHKEILKAHLRTAEEERHKRAKELADRLTRIEKLKRKYQVILLQLSPEGDEEERSQSYYIIKAAQEKEELKREQDELNAQIDAMHKQIQGLENSLTSFNALNQRLHGQKTRGGMTSEDLEEANSLSQQLDTHEEKKKGHFSQAQQMQQEIAGMEEQLGRMQDRANEKQALIQQMESQKQALERELDQLEQKLHRSDLQLQKLSKIIKKKLNLPDTEDTIVDYDMRLQELKMDNTFVLYALAMLAKSNAAIYSTVHNLVEQEGLVLPSKAPSLAASTVHSPQHSKPATPSLNSRTSTPRQGAITPKAVALNFPPATANRTGSNPNSRPNSRLASRSANGRQSNSGNQSFSFGLTGSSMGGPLPKISSKTSSPSSTPPLSPGTRSSTIQLPPASPNRATPGTPTRRN